MEASELIRSTNLPLEQIASQTGFASAATLTKAFKRQFGRTPSEIRRTPASLNVHEPEQDLAES